MDSTIRRSLDPVEVEQLLKPYLKRPLEDYDRDFQYLAEHHDDLMKRYSSQFVAIYDSESWLIAQTPTICGVSLKRKT